jgi:hypothetical protein
MQNYLEKQPLTTLIMQNYLFRAMASTSVWQEQFNSTLDCQVFSLQNSFASS